MADTVVASDAPETVTVTGSSGSLGDVVRPRALVKANDAVVDGWISWEVTSNSFAEADTFRLSFSVNDLPSGHDVSWFATQREIFIEILAGFPADADNPVESELKSQIYGRVDHLDFDPANATLNLTGRDLTAVFIDSKIVDQYVNKTSSEIAEKLVGLHAGMLSSVTATKTKAGTYYDQDQVQLQASRSEWDLLLYLARREAYVVYVSGKTLFFGPNPVDDSNLYDITWQPADDVNGSPTCNALELTFQRDLTVGKGIAVTARSANRKTGKPVVQSYPSQTKAIQAGKASPFGQVQNYYFNLPPDHTPVEVEQYAKARYDAIVAHEMKLMARLPGDNVLSILTPIRVSGLGNAFDQTYYPREITRQMSLDEGYDMTVEAMNVNADSSPES